MAVFVDDVRHAFGRMVMCHMWADSEEELDHFAAWLGLDLKWKQQPPKASWVHYDVSLSKKREALAMGAQLTDKFGPVEHVARLRGDSAKVAQVARLRRGAKKQKMAREQQEMKFDGSRN